MNKRFIKFLNVFVFCSILPASFFNEDRPAAQTVRDGREAESFYRQANQFLEKKRFLEAQDAFRKAMAAAPQEGRYAAALGQFLLWHSEKYEEAVACLNLAISLGYDRDSVVRQKGLALHRLGRGQEAVEILLNGIAKVEEKLRKANPGERPDLKKDIGIAVGFLAIVFRDLERFSESVQLVERIRLQYPDIRDSNIGRAGLPAAFAVAHYNFGEGHYAEALRYFQLASAIASWDPTAMERSADYELQLEMELVRRRQALGDIKPDYVYSIAVLFIARTDVDFVSLDGTRVSGKRELTARHREKAKWIARSLARHWEAMSQGRLGVEVDFIEINSAVTGFHKRWSRSLHIRRIEVRSVDPDALNPSQADFFYNNYRNYDTFALIWNGEDGIATTSNGSQRDFPVIGGQIIRRGFAHISTDQLAFKMFLHELSHNYEAALGKNLAIDAGDGTGGGQPRRAAREKMFPGCAAYTEVGFNDCLLQRAIPNFLADRSRYRESPAFSNVNFRRRFPAPVNPPPAGEPNTENDRE